MGFFGRFFFCAFFFALLQSCKPSSSTSTQSKLDASLPESEPLSLCENSWEQKPGTTDYTTYDSYNKRTYAKPDRSESQTLLGSKSQAIRPLCARARFLKKCFDKAVMENNSSAGIKFKRWAEAHGIHPALALMAKTEQETKMGSLPDSCYGRTCNGIGIGQIITAIDENGRVLSSSDSRWEGISFNILTNLQYSLRVIADKTGYSNSLWDLAFRYNGSVYARMYAGNVVGYYANLKSCGLY
ncbi:hypothetical protein EBU99_00390 [bacterium]|nr:hypothetical protein [bacterium]